MGAELKKKKKRIFWVKIGEKIENNVQKSTNFKEKKGLFRPKKQAGAELGQKVGEKIEYKGQKLTNFKKKDFSGQKNKLGLSFRKKRNFLDPKLGKNLRIMSRN